MSGNNESTSSSAKQQQSYQSNEIDKLLNSGKITNAVDFLHYFKNKNFTTAQANQTNTTPHHQPNVDKPKRQKKSKSNLNDYVNIIQPNQLINLYIAISTQTASTFGNIFLRHKKNI